MGFALAEAFVEIGANDKPALSAIANVKAACSSLGTSFDKLKGYGTAAFAALAGFATASLKAFADGETSSLRLRAALEATGQEVGKNESRLTAFAASMQSITTFSDKAIIAQMSYATSLGVTADKMEDVTKLGIGLASAYFNDNLEEGMKAAALAQEGNFRALQRIIPELKRATNSQQEMDIVVRKGAIGLKLAKAESEGLGGQTKQLWNQVKNLGESFGQLLAPSLLKVTGFLRTTIGVLQSLSPEQKQQIVRWAAIAAGVAGVIAFGPSIVAFGGTVLSTFKAIGSAIFSLGKAMIYIVTSPVGLVVAGFGLIITAIAYAIGTGDTFVERTKDGFGRIAGFMDHLLGSWKGFTSTFSLLWDQAISFVAEGFVNFKSWIIDGWEYLAEGVENVFWGAFEGMYTAYEYLKNGAMQFINWITNAWDKMTDSLSDSMYDAYTAVTDFFKGTSDEEKAANKKAFQDMRSKDKEAKAKGYDSSQGKLDNEYNAKKTAIQKAVDLERTAANQKRQTNRATNEKESSDTLAAIELERRAKLKAGMDAFDKMPKLSDKFKDGVKGIAGALGLGDILKLGTDLEKKFDEVKAKADADKAKADAASGINKIDVNTANEKGKQPTFTGIGDAFKNSIAMGGFGAVDSARTQFEAQQKQLEAQKSANEFHKQTVHLLSNLGADIAKAIHW